MADEDQDTDLLFEMAWKELLLVFNPREKMFLSIESNT